MAIDRATVDHVARLARLDLSEAEREQMPAELSKILQHVEKIQELDLSGLQPTAHALPLRNAMREDEARPSLTPEAALANAPETEDGRFRVPRIVEDAGA